MLPSNGLRVAGVGAEGSKNYAVHSPPPDTFRSRNFGQSARNGAPTDLANDRSPPSLQQVFIRDNGDQRSPTKAPRRSEWLASPDRPRHFERDDRWGQPVRRSSPTRRVSPPRRPSPPRQSSYGYGERRRSPLAHPSNAQNRRIRRASDTFDSPSLYPNWSWKAPEYSPPLNGFNGSGSKDAGMIRSAAPSSKTNSVNGTPRDLDSGKVTYNGLKAVPTGPKKANITFEPVSPLVKGLPHIFVSSHDLPPLRSTVEHLFKALRGSVAKESDIHFDDSGWYLCFEDTKAGLARLQDCYQRGKHMKMFGAYTIHMKLFPFGAQDVLNGGQERSPSVPNGTTEHDVPLNGVNSHTSMFPENGRTLFGSGSLPGLNTTNLSNAFNVVTAISKLVHDAETSHLPDNGVDFRRQSSPLRIPSRLDRDDSSSCISGPTGSDISRSKRLKCHICKASDSFESDNLISCSSCPRRYHRRCHIRPAAPAELGPDHTWQCRRCVKKHIQPRSRLRSSSPASKPILDHLDLPSDEPPLKRQRLDLAEPQRIPIPSPTQGTARKDIILDMQEDVIPMISRASHVTETVNDPVPNSDETHFLEADDLVAKSFAGPAGESISQSATTSISRKPTLVRRKVARTEAISNRGTGSEHDTAEAHPKVQNSHPSERAREEPVERGVNGSQGTVEEAPDRKRNVPRTNGHSVAEVASLGSDGKVHHHPAPESNSLGSNMMSMGNSVLELVASAEIPESPEELRKPVANASSIMADAVMKLQEHPTASFNSCESGSTMNKDSKKNATPLKQQPKLQRMKPGAQMADQCQKCSKKIAYNPSGTNKLCMKCKAATPTIPNTETERMTNAGKVNLVSGTYDLLEHDTHKPGEPGDRQDSEPLSKGPSGIGTDSLPDPASMITMELRKSNSRKACDKCELLQRCIHNVDDQQGEVGSAHLDSADTAETQVGDGNAGDALDFWTTGTALADKEDATGAGKRSLPNLDSHIQTLDGSEISDAQEEADEAPRKAVPKRKSQTRPALSQHDLGDSIERPKGAYEKLIGMALCSAPGHRMRGTDVTQWVAKNISGYKSGEGKWESSMRATLTLKKQGYGGRDGLWRKIEPENTTKKNETCWWELLPGQADKMLHWDPVLRQPVSPPKGWRKERSEVADASKDESPNVPAPAPLPARSKKREKRKRLRQGKSGRGKDALTVEDQREKTKSKKRRITDIDSSSDEEPLSERKRAARKVPSSLEDVRMNDGADSDSNAIKKSDATHVVSHTPKKPSAPTMEQVHDNKLAAQQLSKPVTIAEMIASEAEHKQYSAKSLFDEWPEHDPKNHFDRDAKLAQIKNRPTRKQKFQRLSPWTEMGSPEPAVEYVAANESPSKGGRSVLYPWETTEDNVVQCTTLEELFNLPKNPVAIIHDGQLAYRDGTRNEDGTLPRAKVIYKTGYGKKIDSRL